MEKEQPKFKILMFPWLAHGHIFPFLELAKRLSTRNFTIYLCSTPINLDLIKTSIDQKEYSSFDVKLVELHVPSLPQLPPEMHTTKNLPSNLLPTLLQAFQMSTFSFSDILNSVKPDLLIYDLFQPWAPKIASSKGIPRVYFCTSGATPCSFYHHSYTVGTGSPFPYEAIYLRDHEKVNLRNLIAPYIKDADDDFAFGNFRLSSDIVLVKSCRDVEGKYIDYLSVLSKKRIVSTGPLVVDVKCDDKEHSEIMMEWLNGKNNVRLFPIGEKTSLEEELPAGFLETVKNRGIVISRWAPQNKILAHPSIGGFVSHCGWSSITESMYFGIPIIAMPMKFEQPINARLVVEAGVAVEVEKDVNGRFVGEDVAKAINKVTVEKEFCEVLRDRAKRLSEKIKENAEQEMNETAEQLLRICLKN
ncbi:hypothetical protein DH2020_027701 [Rehmannia glutinosa]|uniref:Glycosyltransferase n=1 Tax=Rehmannia glutinosa TaxID=99300 RepID=A0ABR0VWB3_REHGL